MSYRNTPVIPVSQSDWDKYSECSTCGGSGIVQGQFIRDDDVKEPCPICAAIAKAKGETI